MVIELSGVQFDLKSYAWYENRTNAQCELRRWQTRTHCCGNIVAHDVSLRAQTGKHLLPTQNVSEQNQKHFCVPDTMSGTKMFLILFRNVLCPQQTFPSLRSPRNIMSNNVSSFASTFRFEITSMILDQNWTIRSSVVSLDPFWNRTI